MELKIASWNVNGLSGKIKLGNVYCNEMRDLIRSFDIVGLVETWTTVQSNIKLPGYSHLSKHRRKRCKKGRPSGGLVLYYRKKIKKRNIISGRCPRGPGVDKGGWSDSRTEQRSLSRPGVHQARQEQRYFPSTL